MGVTMPSVEFKLFVNETKLLVLTYVQTHLDDNSRLTSMTALNAYLATDKRSLPTELESIATFQQRLLEPDYPYLFGVWNQQQLLGLVLQTDAVHFRSSDFPEEIATQVWDFTVHKRNTVK